MSNSDASNHRLIVMGIAIHIILLSLALTIFLYKNVDAQQLASRVPFPNIQKEEPIEPISFLFTGDIMLGRYIAVLRERQEGDFPFTYMPDLLESAEKYLDDELDYVVGNLEGPITDSDYVNPGTAMIFNFDPEVVPNQLKEAGFTTLTMANNHTLDMGANGVAQTYNYLKDVGLDAFGHPDSATGPYSSISYEIEGKNITFLGLNDAVYPLDEVDAIEEIKRLDELTDFLIVSVHWGTEYLETAPNYIEEMAYSFAEAGADFIHGHHPHRVQNNETYLGVPIYYSLGNFVFDQYWSTYTQEGQVVLLQLTPTEEGFTLSHEAWMVDLVNQGEPKLRP